MMLAAMRMQKHQVDPVKKITATGSFDRSLYCMAGYLNYEVMCVGAAGGKSGNASGNTEPQSIVYGNGGGGGGVAVGSGALKDLSKTTPCTIGVAGSDGANANYNVSAGSGGKGGDTTFESLIAEGGDGATGGKIGTTTFNSGKGGDGGSNSNGVGSGGVGGSSGYYSGIGLTVLNGDSLPTDGTAVASGGVGGGGGRGRMVKNGTTIRECSDGADGSVSYYQAPGASVSGDLKGATGGGANIEPLTGTEEYYGGGAGNQNGIVVLLMS